MPKPIVVIFLPQYTSMLEVARAKEQLHKTGITDEYHVLCVNSNLESIDIKVFYEKDFNEVKYEELKKLIEDSLHA